MVIRYDHGIFLEEAAHKYGLNAIARSGSGLAGLESFLAGMPSIEYAPVAPGVPFIARTAFFRFETGYTLEVRYFLTSELQAAAVYSTLSRTDTGELLLALTADEASVGPEADLLRLATSNATAGSLTIGGNSADNIYQGGVGTSLIWDKGGRDTVTFSGARSEYKISTGSSEYGPTFVETNVMSASSSDKLVGIDRLKFSDVTAALDVDGSAGQAFRMYQAAFGRTPDPSGLAFQVWALDHGLPLTVLATNFINSPEFQLSYGQLDDAAFVVRLYANVLHRSSDSAGHAYHLGRMASGTSRAEILAGFSESPENKTALIGVFQQGIELLGT